MRWCTSRKRRQSLCFLCQRASAWVWYSHLLPSLSSTKRFTVVLAIDNCNLMNAFCEIWSQCQEGFQDCDGKRNHVYTMNIFFFKVERGRLERVENTLFKKGDPRGNNVTLELCLPEYPMEHSGHGGKFLKKQLRGKGQEEVWNGENGWNEEVAYKTEMKFRGEWRSSWPRL